MTREEAAARFKEVEARLAALNDSYWRAGKGNPLLGLAVVEEWNRTLLAELPHAAMAGLMLPFDESRLPERVGDEAELAWQTRRMSVILSHLEASAMLLGSLQP